MNKKLFFTFSVFLIFLIPFFMFIKNYFKFNDCVFLRILNSEDYIDKNLIREFEKFEEEKSQKKVKVIYDTFDTQENMFNIIKTNKVKYDLVCISDYMFQKIMRYDQNFIMPLEQSKISNYFFLHNNQKNYCSHFIQKILKENNMYDKSICYMWGFIGLVYNPEFIKFKKNNLQIKEIDQNMKYWNNLWNKKYQNTISIKDSIRDTYALGILNTFQKELENSKNKSNVFNYGNDNDQNAQNHINQIKQQLIKLKSNIFGFENDSGKEDIANGKIGINLSWSGDAVYSIKKAKKNKINLHFNVPNDGMTNIWMDQWIMTKYVDSNKTREIAYDFLNFISDSHNVIKNTKKIGFTSPIVSDEIFNFFKNEYQQNNHDKKNEYDLNYFFGLKNQTNNKYKIFVSDDKIYQIKAQFPEAKNIHNLIMMQDFGKNSNLILDMWHELKTKNDDSFILFEILLLTSEISLFLVIYFFSKRRK